MTRLTEVDMTRPWDAEWTTRDGRRIRVGDMDRQHRRNILAMLLRNARRHHTHALIAAPFPADDASDGVFNALLRSHEALRRQDPEQWMREQPLFQAIAMITPPGPGPSRRRWQNRFAAARLESQAAFIAWLEEVA